MLFKSINGAVAVIFLVAAVIQYNDPDPVRWMTIYTAAGLVSVFHERLGKTGVILATVLALVALVWAGTIVAQISGPWVWSELFESMDPKEPRIELGREVGGLSIAALWMGVLIIRSWYFGPKSTREQ